MLVKYFKKTTARYLSQKKSHIDIFVEYSKSQIKPRNCIKIKIISKLNSNYNI